MIITFIMFFGLEFDFAKLKKTISLNYFTSVISEILACQDLTFAVPSEIADLSSRVDTTVRRPLIGYFAGVRRRRSVELLRPG